jgi:hypothetical protein
MLQELQLQVQPSLVPCIRLRDMVLEAAGTQQE